ncbi:retrovirus-related pol polyprotein from transposon TNT 1-94, partial [Tanacetum coccineum]
VVFNEMVMYKDTLKDSGVGADKSVEELQMDSLRKNKTWELVDHSVGQKLVSCKWLFKIKEWIEGVQKLVILSLTACKDYELEQLDVKTAFLHGNLKEVIYMRRSDDYMPVYYMSYAPGEYIYLLLYIYDILIACKSKAEIGSTKSLLKKEFGMMELGEAKKILGMEITMGNRLRCHWVGTSSMVRDFNIERMSKVPYANAVESLMYLMVCMRPDIAYAVSVVSKYLANSGKIHWETVKWILKYLRGTVNVGLVYGTHRGNHVDVTGFVDSDYAKDPDKGRSITGYAFLVQGCVVSWKATLQHVVALSTTEAEYMALTEAVKEAIWLRGLLEELGVELNTVAVNCDNQGAIHLSRNHVFHERTKHINVRYHFIREVLEAKTVKVLKVGTEHNAADALTKVVPGRKLQHCLELLKDRSIEVVFFLATPKRVLVVPILNDKGAAEGFDKEEEDWF